MYDREDIAEHQYEQSASPMMSYLVLAALVTVVGFIAVLAAWTGA